MNCICYICNNSYNNYRSLGSHIKQKHHLSTQDYYDNYIRKEKDGFCTVCNAPTPFINLNLGYQKHCCVRCSQLDPLTQQKIIKTNEEKYGVPCVFQAECIKQKIQNSIHEHLGLEGLANPQVTEKKKKTKLEKYNDENYSNRIKAKQTCLTKFGAENVFASEYGKRKSKETKKLKYGDENYSNRNIAIESYKQTVQKRTPAEKARIKQNAIQRYNNFPVKKKQEIANKISEAQKQYYANLSPEEYASLCLHRKIAANNRSEENIKEAVFKSHITKKLHGTCNSSSTEDAVYIELCKLFTKEGVIHHYMETRYPYHCDFYIKSLDLFIEINAHWTHGKHFFNKDNPDDILLLEKWKKKAITSKYYKNAIYVWTILDLKKLQLAKDNHLNYIALFTDKEIDLFLQKLQQGDFYDKT